MPSPMPSAAPARRTFFRGGRVGGDRHRPDFAHHADLPVLDTADGARITVEAGEFGGERSPAAVYTPLVGLEVVLPGAMRVTLPVTEGYEYGVITADGPASDPTSTERRRSTPSSGAQPVDKERTLTVSKPLQGSAVPALVGQRLDVALDRLQSAGLKGDVQGGGLFGVLDESTWKVVDQDPSPGARLSQGDTVRLDIDRA